jgi:V-type H+-transporting ATPase subunit d
MWFRSYQMSAGFLEGVVRGYKGALLTQANYHNLTQCENLEGIHIYNEPD